MSFSIMNFIEQDFENEKDIESAGENEIKSEYENTLTIEIHEIPSQTAQLDTQYEQCETQSDAPSNLSVPKSLPSLAESLPFFACACFCCVMWYDLFKSCYQDERKSVWCYLKIIYIILMIVMILFVLIYAFTLIFTGAQ